MPETSEPPGTDLGNLETPITGEIPDEALTEVQMAGDGGSGPSTEAQIIGDLDQTDIPEPAVTVRDVAEPGIDLTEQSAEDVALPEQGTSIVDLEAGEG